MAVAASQLPTGPNDRQGVDGELDADTIFSISRRISRILAQYPDISATRLGNHIRPYQRQWRLVLEDMIAQRIVDRVVVNKPTQTGALRATYVFRLTNTK